ncbi:hypothetical protein C7M42_00038 [Pediococcus acidilactici]|nr:hypothetical protein C7M42_00038 [Pediococcus acidilactici]
MLKHYITKYYEDNNLYVEAWIQFDLFRKTWCFSRKK